MLFSFWHSFDFLDHGRLFTFLAMADTLRLLGSPGPWEREALSYYHHSLILDTVQPPYDNDVFIAGKRARKNDHVIPFQPLLYLFANIIHTFVFHVPGSLIQLRLHQKSKSRKISNRFHTAFTLTILPLCALMTLTIDAFALINISLIFLSINISLIFQIFPSISINLMNTMMKAWWG